MSTRRGSAQLADLRGHSVPPPNYLTNGVVLSLTCSVPPISSIFLFVAILLVLFIEPTTPVPSRVASQWRERPSSYNVDHNSSEMAGASPVGRRARTTRTTLLFGAHSSSWLLVASVPRQLCRIDHAAAELPKPHPSDLFAPRSASMLHCTSPRAASTSPKIARRPVLFFYASGLRQMHDAPQTSILESTLRRTIDGNFAC